MKNKTIILVLFIILGIESIGLAKDVDTIKILNVADSAVRANTSQDFFNYLSRPENRISVFRSIPPNTNYDRDRINDNDYIKQFEKITYIVGYGLKLRNGDIFLLKTDTTTDKFSWGYPEIAIKMDTNYNIVEIPDFNMLEKVYTRLVNVKIIDKDSAIKYSMPYFSIKKKKIERAVVEFDVTSDLLYWRISKSKGQSNVHEEQVLIDGETSAFIKKEDKYYITVIGY
jgi:hypothetical protein